MKTIGFTFITLLLLISCKNKESKLEGYEINGIIKNAPDSTVVSSKKSHLRTYRFYFCNRRKISVYWKSRRTNKNYTWDKGYQRFYSIMG